MHGQDRLAVSGEQHEVGFPVAGSLAIGGIRRPFGQRNTAFNEGRRASSPPTTEAALALAAWQIVPPAIVLGAGHLRINEAVDALVRDHLAPASRASRPAICSGDQPHFSRSITARRSDGSRSRREPFQRRARVCS